MSTPTADMLYQHKKTGARVEIVSEWDNGDWFMVKDQDGRLYTAYKTELTPDEEAHEESKNSSCQRLKRRRKNRVLSPRTHALTSMALPHK
jgi:SH3-like domain-containing protein